VSRLSEAQYSDKYPMSIVSPVKSFNNSTATCPSIFRLSKSSIICRSLISLSVIVVLKQMPYNVCVYAGCGFRSHDKSPWANEITKTKLQTNPSQSGHINSSSSYVPKKSNVPEVTSLSCLLTAFLAAPSPNGCSLSPEAERVRSPKKNQHKVCDLSAVPQSCRPAANFPRRRPFKKVNRHLGQFFTTICQR